MANDLPPGVQWHLDQGGHNGRLAGHALRLLNEAVELCVAAGARRGEIMTRVTLEIDKAIGRGDFSDTWSPCLFEEMADVQILLNVLAYHAGSPDLRPHCEEKLKILYQRKWTIDNDGVLWRPKEVE